MSDSTSISVLVVTPDDDHVAAVNTALRDAGHAAHCIKVGPQDDLESAIANNTPDLILPFDTGNHDNLKHICQVRNTCGPHVPVILVCDAIAEDVIAKAMETGARDIVTLANTDRFLAVTSRELHSYWLENALERVMGSANQYKQELNSLKQVSVEAIADIQEGIIVNANPAWLELFEQPDGENLIGHTVMDMCRESDRTALKGALVACQRGKWQDSTLDICGLRPGGEEFPVAFSLESVEHEGAPAVRMLVAPELNNESSSPEKLVELAIQRDQVTGFLNRQHFLNTVTERLTEPPQGGVRALAYIRPDKFSRAHRDIGLMGTEAALSQLAQLLKELTQPGDICGRFGGTMFTVMLERGTMADVEAWAKQFLNLMLETVFEYSERSTVITCSIGLCEVDSDKKPVINLVADSELACSTARAEGGNRIELCESSGEAKKIRQDDSVWVPRIRGALMENRLRLEHQPIASLNVDIEGAFDTLVRMLDEDGNTVLPSEFMPVAERTGLVKNIDRWIIGASISFCAANNAKLVFIRLSRDSLLDETLAEWLQSQAAEAKIPPTKVCFEIAEEVVNKHLRQTQSLSEKLRKLGFRFAVDHFGQNDESSRVIDLIPMDYLKIDASLMQGLHKNPNIQNKIKELCRHAADKGIQTIAERVQDANTMAVLWQLGVAHIQGNYVQSSEIVLEDVNNSTQTTLALALEE
ncbi:MAG: GGDEF domain-containing protein [Gammaproteobacteria bacterium]|nr:GGDEF domain-containing protein [Gammaproteobacteria bacterium]